jgi:hypothetical protein
MPLGSLPCDIAYQGKYAIVGSLDGPDRSKAHRSTSWKTTS